MEKFLGKKFLLCLMGHQHPSLLCSAFSVTSTAQGQPVPESEAGRPALGSGCIFQSGKVPPAWQAADLQGAG